MYNDLYEIKKKEDKNSAKYWFAKIVMNASIGKFASGDWKVPHYINYFCMSYARMQLYTVKYWLRKFAVPYVIYGDTDSFCLRSGEMNNLVRNVPSMLSADMPLRCGDMTGEIECVSDEIIVLGKKLYWLNEKKFSAKGHNRGEITRETFMAVMEGEEVTTTRLGPEKNLFIADNVVHSNVTPFVPLSRHMNITVNKYKRHVGGGVYVGPFIINC